MATYLQGVTDYIPQFQPFQPDLNFYNNVLQTKQTQYDSNYKQLNQVYGQYLYADLTHGENIQRKEELLKNIDVTLKKVSGLDLSLEKNLTQATQVFKPFYEDQYLMKDMAYTKNFNNQKRRAEGLKNSLDDKIRAQYWEDGVLALDYKREEFKDSAIGDTLNIASPSYTNYVNVQEKALKLAKDSDLSIESVNFSPDGKWIVKTKNGQQLEEPLSKLFEATLGSDPAIMEMYKTQSYVNRKNFSYYNAAQFGGDKNAAEMNYLQTHFTRLKDQQIAQHKALQNSSTVYTNKIKDLQAQLDAGSKDPRIVAELNKLQENNSINESVLNRVQRNIDIMSEGESSTASTSTGKNNPYGDIMSLRHKVDNAIASSLMEKDLNQAAHVFAYRNSKEDISANPYAVLDIKHQYDMQNTALRNQGLRDAANIRSRSDKQINFEKELIAEGTHHRDLDPNSPTYGQLVMNAEIANIQHRNVNDGNVTGKQNVKVLSSRTTSEQIKNYALEGIDKMSELIDKYVSSGYMTSAQADAIYNSGGNKKLKGLTRQEFQEQLRANPEHFLTRVVGDQSLASITKRFDYLIKNNARIKTYNEDIQQWQPLSQRLTEYGDYAVVQKNWQKKAVKVVESELRAQGFKGADLLYTPNADRRTREDYYKELLNSKLITSADLNVLKDKLLGDKKSKAISDAISLANRSGAMDTPMAWTLKVINNLKNIGPGNVIDNWISGSLTEKYDYDELLKASNKVWMSGKVETPPAINVIGASRNKQTGLYTTGIQSIGVAPYAYNTPGNRYFSQFRQDFDNLDLGDFTKVRTSFTGASQTGLKAGDEQNTNNITRAILNNLFNASENTKSGLKNFTIAAQKIAGNDATKGAMIIYPSKEFIESYIKGEDKGLVTQQMANDMMTNGISIVTDSKNWSNELFTKGNMTPVEAIIDYDKIYQYNSLYDNGTLTIEKNKAGSAKYKSTFVLNSFDDNGTPIKTKNIAYHNDSPDDLINQAQNMFAIQNEEDGGR
jgi:hypothetical protein